MTGFAAAGRLAPLLLAVATAAAAPDTDTASWRAAHGVLLGIARAGGRLVAVGDRGTILLSDNDGKDWRQAPAVTDNLLTSVMFVTAKDGWAVGQDATILRTRDGGQTWHLDYSAPGSDKTLFSVAAASARHLIASGAYAIAMQTQDGNAWTGLTLSGLDEDYHLNCVAAGAADPVIVGEAGHAFRRVGQSWAPIKLPYEGSQFGCLQDHAGKIYSFGLRGRLFSLDAAKDAWTTIDTGETRALFGGTILSDGRLALAGAGGALLLFDPVTGQTQHLATPTGATLSGVAETADHHLALVGADGVHIVDPAQTDGGAP